MSKTKEEPDALKEEVEAVNEKLQELTEEEIAQISGGGLPGILELGFGLPGGGFGGYKQGAMATATVADLEKHGLGNLGGAVATPGGGASHLVN